jgi:GMP reductase
MRIEQDIKLDFCDVLLRPKRSTLNSRKDVNLEREFKFYHSKKIWKGIPIMSSNMATTGTFEMAKVLSKYKVITVFHKYYSVEDYINFFKEFDNPDYISYSLGIRDQDLKKFDLMNEKGLLNNFSFITIDVPNGYLQRFLEVIKIIRNKVPNHIIIAGNVVTNEMTEEIILAGADIVKIGIGSGSACTTRKMTGVGYPQLSAVIECSDAAHGLKNVCENLGGKGTGHVISDGGIVDVCDFAKAFAGGADFVMVGSLFSGFEESGGKLIEKGGKKYKEYFGSSSKKAMEEFYGSKANYRASEGRYLQIPYKGKIEFFLEEIFGSLRSTGTYIGAKEIKEFSRRATFIRVNHQLNRSLERYEVND